MPSIAIDFGTTRTKVAFLDPESKEPRLIELGHEVRAIIPSLFYIPKGGLPLVGDDAQAMVDEDPEGVVVGLKREIHKLGKYRCGGGRPSIDRKELAGCLFRYIREQCEREVFHGDLVNTCVLSVPVAFEEQKRESIREAARIGGFESVSIVEEPVAAARAWLARAGQRVSAHVVVCDVGGGTTDFALLQHDQGRFTSVPEVQPVGFSLGGNDVDEAIMAQLLDSYAGDCGGVEQRRSGFLVRLRQVREAFSRNQPKPEVGITLGGSVLKVQQDTVASCSAEFVEQVSGELEKFLSRCRAIPGVGMPPVLLVGGGSRIAGLRDAIEKLSPGRVFQWNQSDYAIVLGATLGHAGSVVAPGQGQCDALPSGPKPHGRQVGPEPVVAMPKGPAPVTDILALLGDGKVDQAFRLATDAIILNPDGKYADLWFDCSLAMANGDLVLETARDTVRKREGDPWSTLCLVFWLTHCGRQAEANQALAALLESEQKGHPAVQYSWLLANEDTKNSQYIQALDVLLRVFPSSPALLLAKAKLLKGQHAKVAKLLDEAFKAAPNSLAVLSAQVSCGMESDEGPEAAANLIGGKLRHMERIAPGHFLTIFARAAYHESCGQPGAAIEALDQVAANPQVAASEDLATRLLRQRARAYQRLGKPAEELGNVEELVRRLPRDPEIRAWRAGLLLDAKKYAESIADSDLVLAQNPVHQDALMARAWSRFFLWDKHSAAAAQDFDKLCYLDPGLSRARFGATCCMVREHLEAARCAGRIFEKCYVYPEIPGDKLLNAIHSYGGGHLGKLSAACFLFDSTFFGGARDGVCITHDHLLAHNIWEPTGISIRLSEIQKVVVKKESNVLIINRNPVNCAPISANHKAEVLDRFSKLLLDLGQLHRLLDQYSKS